MVKMVMTERKTFLKAMGVLIINKMAILNFNYNSDGQGNQLAMTPSLRAH